MAAADHHLLFGLLALQNGLINQGHLVHAFQAWTLDKSKSLADHLIALGHLNGAQKAVVEAMADLHVAKHGHVERSLAAIPAGLSTHESLARLGDPDIEGTLARVRPPSTRQGGESDAYRTVTYSVGSATSDGMRFRVLRPHARGGLGAVFVALDQELHREVALKQILDSHADDPTSRQRFLLEAEVTGGLEHPGIVPVYGLGTYGDGRPYYAMRFIRGDSLKEAIARFHTDETLKKAPGRRSLELRKLLRRFLDVCNAIDYAHSRGVLHRDIKPANIIVGRHGETLVVDWGLAKARGKGAEPSEEPPLAPSAASGSAETLPGSALGTPAYMSPEQARGDLDSLGPRSDVYSLGGTLYCLLTGKPPQEGDDIGEVLRKVQRGEFSPPGQLDPSIDKALEAVCLKAMAPKPEDRYASGRALGEDIERWMADEPVTAWREPWARTLLRWLTRHRTGVTGAAAAGLAMLVGLGAVAAVQARANVKLTRSGAAVQARYDLAVEAVKTFHTGVSEDFLLREEKFKELRDRLLKSAADFYGKLGALLGKETDVGSRRALAASNFELAELTGKVGRQKEALAAHRAVLAARQALAAEPAAGAAVKADVGRSLNAVARLLEATGQPGGALAMYRRSESLLAGLAGAEPATRVALSQCRTGLGDVLFSTGKADDALAAYKLARADQEALASAPGASSAARNSLASTISRFGILLSKTGRPAEAESEYRAAVAINEKLAEENPAVTNFRSSLAMSHNNLGVLLTDTGRPAEAESEYRAAVAINEKLAEENPAVTNFRNSLAMSHNNLGLLLTDTGRPAEAEAEYRAALAINENLAEENPAVTNFRNSLAMSHNNLGLLLTDTGRPAEAEAEYRAALAIKEKLAEENPAVTEFRNSLAISHNNLGILQSGTGRPAEAESEYRAALAIQEKLAEENPAVTEFRNRLASIHQNLGLRLWQTGRPAEAEAAYRAAIALGRKLADDNPAVTEYRRRLAEVLKNYGELLAEMGRPGEAEAAYRAAIALHRKLAGENPAVTEFRSGLAHSYLGLGWLLTQTGRPQEAEAEYRTALVLYRNLADDNPRIPDYRDQAANLENNLSVVLRRLGHAAEAREFAERAVALREALVQRHPRTTDYRCGLAENHLNRGLARRALGDPAGAVADLRRALGLYAGLPSRSGEQWYLFGCSHAALSGLAGQAGSGLSATEALGEADAAMSLLYRAVGVGYVNPDAYRTEDTLDPLRGRSDFQLLLMDVAFPAEPFAKDTSANP